MPGFARISQYAKRFFRVAPSTPPVFSFNTWSELADSGETAVAFCHPMWRGVRVAAYSHGMPVIETPDCRTRAEALLRDALAAGVRTIVVHGFPLGSEEILATGSRLGLETRCVLHSSPVQHGVGLGEETVVHQALELIEKGKLGKLGFVKKGIAEIFQAQGVPSEWVPNRMRVSSTSVIDVDTVDSARLNVGVFMEPIWRKNVVAQLGAVSLLDNARAHVIRRPAVKYLSGLELIEHGELPWERFLSLQGKMDLNLYVTLSECHPNTPIESYLAGVPCLTAPTSYLFRDDQHLWRLTTVEELDNPVAIADAAARLYENRREAVARANAWIKVADEDAKERWVRFLAVG